ncbi:MAG: hypothetical protein V4739_01865, partial [Pseudomonadota bacterium]
WREINAGGPDVVDARDPNANGFLLTYSQDMGKVVGGKMIGVGKEKKFVVSHKLTPSEKIQVALAIFMEVSIGFETLQDSFPNFVTKSGFSQEDLVSNLIGFYIACGVVTHAHVLAEAKPVSKEVALSIWDNEGPVGSNKNKTFMPLFSKATTKQCHIACDGLSPRPPSFMNAIKPERKGRLFWDYEFDLAKGASTSLKKVKEIF